jgi:hypothetical protein
MEKRNDYLHRFRILKLQKQQQMKKFLITCELPKNKLDEKGDWIYENGQPVYETTNGFIEYEENYFCGFKDIEQPEFKGMKALEWDTDINFAIQYASHYEAKQARKRIDTGEIVTIREMSNDERTKAIKHNISAMKIVFILIVSSFLMSCTKPNLRELAADNVTVNFENSATGNDVIKFTDLQNGQVDIFDEANGIIQTGKLNEVHLYKIEWTQNPIESHSCSIKFSGNELESAFLYESLGTQTAVLDSVHYCTGFGFEINCR